MSINNVINKATDRTVKVIPLPPLEEQHQVANKLFEEIIENNNAWVTDRHLSRSKGEII